MICISDTGQARKHKPVHASLCILAGALLALLVPARGVAQTMWSSHNSPVLTMGPGWESAWVAFVSVIYQDSQYVMWYSGGDNTNGGNLSVGRATSSDGVHWTKDTLNPVMQHSSSAWDSKAAWVPKVLKIGNGYTMWFTGSNSSDLWQIGRATSKDGRVWVQDSTNPVVEVGAPGTWDAALVHTGSVLFDGTKYRMWYTGLSTWYTGGIAGIGLATSSDGIHWIKDTLDNPVLRAGSPTAWDKDGVGECSVAYDSVRHVYHMFYEGNELDYFKQPSTSGIGHATSSDGIHWMKDTLNNPVLRNNQGGTWTTVAQAPFVLLRNSVFYMWYSGDVGMGYATAPVTGVSAYSGASSARDFKLLQNYPNPFNPTTMIRYAVPQHSFVTLTVFNVLGQQVARLVNGEVEAGYHEVQFDATGLASGTFFYRLQAGAYVDTKNLLLIR